MKRSHLMMHIKSSSNGSLGQKRVNLRIFSIGRELISRNYCTYMTMITWWIVIGPMLVRGDHSVVRTDLAALVRVQTNAHPSARRNESFSLGTNFRYIQANTPFILSSSIETYMLSKFYIRHVDALWDLSSRHASDWGVAFRVRVLVGTIHLIGGICV